MQISKNWLQDFIVEKLPDTDKLVDGLIMHVFEVEEVLKVGDDEVMEIKTLPDRNHYALSHRGIAKEVCAIFNLTYKDVFEIKKLPESKKLSIKIEDTKLCRRYMGAYIQNIKVGESPDWLKERLESIGQKSINNIVDATNYVMYSLGQPLHAFDADKLNGTIVARAGAFQESLNLLDATGLQDKKDRVIELGKGECVIADNTGPLVLAGIKGGAKSGISENTKNIILEAANFDPVTIRKFSTIYNLRSETSKRFENEITTEYAEQGLQMCIDLILQIAGGELEGIKDVYPVRVEEHIVKVSEKEIEQLLGVKVEALEIEKILKRLDFQFVFDGTHFVVTAPVDRFDIRIKEDLIEEIGRIYGYEHIEARRPEIVEKRNDNKRFVVETIIREKLISLGFTEMYTYAFEAKGEIELSNAFASDKSFMRNSISTQLAEALVQNLRYADLLGLSKIKIFEIGSVFLKAGEKLNLAMAVGFSKKFKGETPEGEILDIFTKVCEELGIDGQKLSPIVKNGVLEVDLQAIIDLSPDNLTLPKYIEREIKKYSPISVYPFSVRDIAVWTEGEGNEGEIEMIIKKHARDLLQRVSLFDIFSKDGKTSYAYRLVLQSMEKTLEEGEINEIMKNITDELNGIKGWEVR